MRADAVWDAVAGVADRHGDVAAGRNVHQARRVGLGKDPILSRNREHTTVGHGVAPVDDEVHDDLLDLPRVCGYTGEVIREHEPQDDIFADQPPQHVGHAGHERVLVHQARMENLAPAERQQAVRERGAPLRRVIDELKIAPRRVVGSEPAHEDLGSAGDHHQEVVEVVRDPPGQPSDGFQLLGVPILGLEPATPIHHRVEGLGERADLVAARHRQVVVEVTRCHRLVSFDQLRDRLRDRLREARAADQAKSGHQEPQTDEAELDVAIGDHRPYRALRQSDGLIGASAGEGISAGGHLVADVTVHVHVRPRSEEEQRASHEEREQDGREAEDPPPERDVSHGADARSYNRELFARGCAPSCGRVIARRGTHNRLDTTLWTR